MHNPPKELYVHITVYTSGKHIEYGPGNTALYDKRGDLLAANHINSGILHQQPITTTPSSSLHALCIYDAAGKLYLKDTSKSREDNLVSRFRHFLAFCVDVERISLQINDAAKAEFEIKDAADMLKAQNELEKLLPKTEYVAMDPREYTEAAAQTAPVQAPTSPAISALSLNSGDTDDAQDRQSTDSLDDAEDLAIRAALASTMSAKPAIVQDDRVAPVQSAPARLFHMFKPKPAVGAALAIMLGGLAIESLSCVMRQQCRM